MHTVELEAGQFKHPHLGQGNRIDVSRQRVQQTEANVASHGDGLARLREQLTRERGCGGLAICARDGQHLGGITALSLQVTQSASEQIELTADPQANGLSRLPDWRDHYR